MLLDGRGIVIRALREMPYEEYLCTVHWHQVRQMAFRRHGHRCGICIRSVGLDIHHITYEHLGFESPEDVIPLCREHHQLRHEVLRHVLHAEFERQFHA